MKTLRQHFLEMYRLTLDDVITRIKKKGYITFDEAEDLLQKQILKFERPYYHVKYPDVDPFSEKFVTIVFDEFQEFIRSSPGIKVKEFLIKEGEYPEVVYGFNEETMELAYRKRKGIKS